MGIRDYMLSFVEQASDVEQLREEHPGCRVMAKIESRPMKGKAWEYIFFLDMAGHAEDQKIAAALEELKAHCQFLKVLGSYPKAR